MSSENEGRWRVESIIPAGLQRIGPDGRIPGCGLYGHLYVATSDLARAPIVEGDYLFLVHSKLNVGERGRLQRHTIGSVRQLARRYFPALRKQLARLEFVGASWFGSSGCRLARYLGHRSVMTGYDHTSRVFVLRPPIEIEAGSDDAAILELLSTVSCRMPDQEATDA